MFAFLSFRVTSVSFSASLSTLESKSKSKSVSTSTSLRTLLLESFWERFFPSETFEFLHTLLIDIFPPFHWNTIPYSYVDFFVWTNILVFLKKETGNGSCVSLWMVIVHCNLKSRQNTFGFHKRSRAKIFRLLFFLPLFFKGEGTRLICAPIVRHN